MDKTPKVLAIVSIVLGSLTAVGKDELRQIESALGPALTAWKAPCSSACYAPT